MREYFMIRKLINEGKLENAIKRAREMQNQYEKSMVMCMIAEAMIYDGIKEATLLLNEAFDVVKEMEDDFTSSLFIAKIAFTMAIAGKTEEAIKMIEHVNVDSERVYALVRIYHLLREKGEIEKARKVLEMAEEAIYEMEDDFSKITSIIFAVHAFIEIGEEDKAMDLLKHVKNMTNNLGKEETSHAYFLFSEIMVKLGKLNDAMELIENVMENYEKAWIMADVAHKKRSMDLLERAVEIAGKMEPGYEKVSILSKIATMMAEFGDSDGASKLINDCMDISEKMEDKMEKAMAFAIISYAMFENGGEGYMDMLEKAIKISAELKNFEKEEASLLIASVLFEMGRDDDAMTFINGIKDEETRMAVCISLANDLILEKRMRDAMKIADSINDRVIKGRIRSKI